MRYEDDCETILRTLLKIVSNCYALHSHEETDKSHETSQSPCPVFSRDSNRVLPNTRLNRWRFSVRGYADWTQMGGQVDESTVWTTDA